MYACRLLRGMPANSQNWVMNRSTFWACGARWSHGSGVLARAQIDQVQSIHTGCPYSCERIWLRQKALCVGRDMVFVRGGEAQPCRAKEPWATAAPVCGGPWSCCGSCTWRTARRARAIYPCRTGGTASRWWRSRPRAALLRAFECAHVKNKRQERCAGALQA